MRGLSIAMCVGLLTACTSFGASERGDPPPSSTSSTSPDGAAPPDPQPKSDGGVASGDGGPQRALRCGSTDCEPGINCCITGTAEICGDETCNGGWVFSCFGPPDCPADKPICCHRDKRATCEVACEAGGSEVCLDNADCRAPAECVPDSCGANQEFGFCAKTSVLRPMCL